MTEQPETMLEYHFRKLGRRVVVSAMLVICSITLTGAALTAQSDPAMSVALGTGAFALFVETYGMVKDGWVRRVINTLFRTDLSKLKRPDERGPTEVLADD